MHGLVLQVLKQVFYSSAERSAHISYTMSVALHQLDPVSKFINPFTGRIMLGSWVYGNKLY